jgi:hypothetical protein
MPIKHSTPQPAKFPCRIGVDYWIKQAPNGRMTPITFKYADSKMDIEGWTDPTHWLPIPFDLVLLKTDIKTRRGWWTGSEWYSLRLQPKEKVLYWKSINEK